MARLNWQQREQLILEAISELEDGAAGQLQNGPIAEAAGLDPDDVALGLQALHDGGYILGSDMPGYGGPAGLNIFGARLAPAGRVQVRQWPGEDAAEALLAALDDAAERTDDPAERTAIEQAKTGLRGLAGKVLTEVSIAYAKRVSGLDG